MKDIKMKEFLLIYELKFIKWNANIMEMLEVFHIQNFSILKYVVYVVVLKNHILFKLCLQKHWKIA